MQGETDTMFYTYNPDGIRTSKTVNGVTAIPHSDYTWRITEFNSNYINVHVNELTASFECGLMCQEYSGHFMPLTKGIHA